MSAFRKFDPYAALKEAAPVEFSGSSNFSRGTVDFSAAQLEPAHLGAEARRNSW